MKRNAFMLDLLKPELEIATVFDQLNYKRELTTEDIDQIASACRKIELACQAIKIQGRK